MDDLTDIFDPDQGSAGDSTDDFDRELATTGMILQKLAEEQGIDLDSLPEEDVANLITSLHGDGEASEIYNQQSSQLQSKEASQHMSQYEPTVADVSLELQKVAANNGIDINDVSREEYAEAFDGLAEQMSSPEYFEKQAEMEEKLAEADSIGRFMAHSFLDELEEEKLAAGAVNEKGNPMMSRARRRNIEAKRDAAFKARAESGKGPRMEESLSAGRHSAKDVRGERAKIRLDRIKGKRGVKGALNAAKSDYQMGRSLGGGRASSAMHSAKRNPRVAAAAGLAGLAGMGAAGYGAKKLMDKKSFDESFEDDAVAYGNVLLLEDGLIEDGDIEFSKFAEYADENYSEAVEARAIELLTEAGWL